ncbi:uncharacterized protein [Triticum aestivum]|uniref:uncharacterized protein isoform X3 n=1 Tax=Triticum aestivum TaxID=4565 RepID=UPI001D00F72F|nr:uncharacterized protein LOC123137062 isoform X3 [Triticum aestivum]
MEAASPCFNYSSGPPSARALPPRVPPATTVSWLSPAQRWCISCSQIQARAPTPSTTGSRARRWATALPTARGSSPQCRRGSGPVSYTPPSNTSLRPSFIEPAAALPSYSCPCSSIDVPAVIHCTANILSPADLQLGEVSNYSWRRSRPAVICTNTSPGGIDLQLAASAAAAEVHHIHSMLRQPPPPLSVADACNHVQPPTGRGHRGRAMPRELELNHPQLVPLQVAAEKQNAEVQR